MKDEYDGIKKSLDKLHKEKPEKTVKELKEAIVRIDNSGNNNPKGILYDIKDNANIWITIGLCLLIIIIGFVFVGSKETIGLFFGGLVFFISGYFIGHKIPGFGLIFLFSHGVTGFYLMCLSMMFKIGDNTSISLFLSNPIFTDKPTLLIFLLILALVLSVLATLVSVLYSTSLAFRNLKYSINYALAIYATSLLVLGTTIKAFNLV